MYCSEWQRLCDLAQICFMKVRCFRTITLKSVCHRGACQIHTSHTTNYIILFYWIEPSHAIWMYDVQNIGYKISFIKKILIKIGKSLGWNPMDRQTESLRTVLEERKVLDATRSITLASKWHWRKGGLKKWEIQYYRLQDVCKNLM